MRRKEDTLCLSFYLSGVDSLVELIDGLLEQSIVNFDFQAV